MKCVLCGVASKYLSTCSVCQTENVCICCSESDVGTVWKCHPCIAKEEGEAPVAKPRPGVCPCARCQKEDAAEEHDRQEEEAAREDAESEISGAIGADGYVYSDADPGL